MLQTSTEPATPYSRLAASYDRLVDWVIAERGESPRDRIADFLHAHWRTRPAPVKEVLEVCCGTGLTLTELVGRGYRVTGLDRSAAMLEQAGRRLGPDVPLIRATLPEIPVTSRFDAVISAAAGFNYLGDESVLAGAFESVARVLRPGGTFVFDLLSGALLDRSFDTAAPKVHAAELDGVAYIWTFETPASRAHYDLTYVQFLRDGEDGDSYTRSREVHRMYALPHETIRRLAARAGFTGIEVRDNYTERPASADTLYETWILSTGDGAADRVAVPA